MRKKKKGIQLGRPNEKKIIVILLLLGLVVAVSLLKNKAMGADGAPEPLIQGEVNKKAIDQNANVYLNIDGDFPGSEQGLFILKVRIDPIKLVEQFHKVPKYIVFFESKIIPSVLLRYNLLDGVLEGGSPFIRSGQVNLLDGSQHEVKYTFRAGRGQAIFFDGKKVAQDLFLPGGSLITGTAVMNFGLTSLGEFPVEGGFSFLDDYSPNK